MRGLTLLIGWIIGLGTVCQAQPVRPWSVRMAESVMQQKPVLSERWHYEVGVMLRAFEELWQRTGEARYFDYIRTNIDRFVTPEGAIRTYEKKEYNLDQINTGKLLFLLYAQTGDERYRRAIDTLRDQLRHHPRTSEGGFWHKKIYPYQLWLDGVYMMGPFLVRYGVTFDDTKAIEETTHEILLVARYLRDPRTGLYYHGWDEKRQQIWADSITGRSANFWGRGMGWYAMALVDVLDFLPLDHPDRSTIIRILRDLAEAIVRVQDPVTGLWYQVLDLPAYPGNYLEASASSMFVYTLAKGVRKGYLPPEYLEVARRGYRGIVQNLVSVDPDGMVHLNQICAVAGLGGPQRRDGSIAYYLSEPIVSDDPKGVGPFILASLEVEAIEGRALER
jgi:unsaturated rhamnogalacturonyl hydrolase